MNEENTSEKKTSNNSNKNKLNKKKNKADTMNIAFFVILIVALIAFTIIIFIRPQTATYETEFGDVVSTVSLSDTKFAISVIINQETKSIQKGTYKEVSDNNKEDDSHTYELNFDKKNESTESIVMTVKNDTLSLIYEDGTKITYKEK